MSRILPDPKTIFHFDELLELEQQTGFKYELIDGHIVAMTGGSKAHNLIALGLFSEIERQKEERCRLYVADVKLRLYSGQREGHPETATYPDVMLACGEETSDLYEENPLLLAEVISDSTARKDKGTKREKYTMLASLYAYLILSQTDMMMTVYQRKNDEWIKAIFLGGDAEITLAFDGNHSPVKLNLGKIYKYVENRM